MRLKPVPLLRLDPSGRAIFDFGLSGFAGSPEYHAPLRWPLKPGVKS